MPWWQTHFDAQYLNEYEPLFDLQADRREVSRLLELLGELPSGSRVLDCPCGQGRHSHLLAEAGYDVDGLDYSNELLAVARQRGSGRTLRYRQGDMRSLPSRWTGRFSAVVNLFTSFGFFDESADDRKVLAQFARVLKPGGLLVWHGGSRDGVMARFLARDWWSSANGTLFGQERAFDPLSGFLEVRSTWRGDGGNGERSHRIRLYTASELAERMRDVGLIVEQSYDAWSRNPLTRRSSEMLLVARKD
ncbi:MAG: methyltransferase domain-containing protein [Gemmatimonadota bacterium]|nr:methyltransferase domain-containing protein [Gemmatimonadota bacterium]